MNIGAPPLVTPRLRLRPHSVADFEALAAMWGDPGVVRYIGGKPSSRSETWARLLRYGGMWRLLGFGFWAIEDAATGAFLGDIGLLDAHREIVPPIEEPEVGWAIVPAAQGRGIASEALTAVLSFADSELGLASTVCLIEDGNAPSLAIAAKFGFKPYASTEIGSAAAVLFRRMRYGG